jgi:hypothetical protein
MEYEIGKPFMQNHNILISSSQRKTIGCHNSIPSLQAHACTGIKDLHEILRSKNHQNSCDGLAIMLEYWKICPIYRGFI